MNEKVATLRLVGGAIHTSFMAMKGTLQYFTEIKVKTKNNDIILGKWHKRKR